MEIILVILISIISLIFYFVPSIVAYSRKHQNFIPILLLNIFIGWTFIGWVIALIWSFTHQDRRSENLS